MGRTPCCDKKGLKQGKWSHEEDQKLIFHVQQYGHLNWSTLPKFAGLLRCGKSCRHRWTNYLRPGIKRENFTTLEEEAIVKLHQILGNRWSAIAAELPGRTYNDIRNYWRKRVRKRQMNNNIINNNNERDSRVNNEPVSKYAENNLTTKVTMVAVVEEGDHDKGENVGNHSVDYKDDIWDDLLLGASLFMAEEWI